MLLQHFWRHRPPLALELPDFARVRVHEVGNCYLRHGPLVTVTCCCAATGQHEPRRNVRRQFCVRGFQDGADANGNGRHFLLARDVPPRSILHEVMPAYFRFYFCF